MRSTSHKRRGMRHCAYSAATGEIYLWAKAGLTLKYSCTPTPPFGCAGMHRLYISRTISSLQQNPPGALQCNKREISRRALSRSATCCSVISERTMSKVSAENVFLSAVISACNWERDDRGCRFRGTPMGSNFL